MPLRRGRRVVEDEQQGDSPWNVGGRGSLLDRFGQKERTGLGAHLHVTEEAFRCAGRPAPASVSEIEEQLLLGIRPTALPHHATAGTGCRARDDGGAFPSPPRTHSRLPQINHVHYHSPPAPLVDVQRIGGDGAAPGHGHFHQYRSNPSNLHRDGNRDGSGVPQQLPPLPLQRRSAPVLGASASASASANADVAALRLSAPDAEPGEAFLEDLHRLRTTQDAEFLHTNVYGTPKQDEREEDRRGGYGGPAGRRRPQRIPRPLATREADELREELRQLRTETARLREGALGQTLEPDEAPAWLGHYSGSGPASPPSPPLPPAPLKAPAMPAEHRWQQQRLGRPAVAAPSAEAQLRQVSFAPPPAALGAPPTRSSSRWNHHEPPPHAPVPLPMGSQAQPMHPLAVAINSRYNAQLTAAAMDAMLCGGRPSPPPPPPPALPRPAPGAALGKGSPAEARQRWRL